MKKLLLVTLCASAFALTACDKKPAGASASGAESKPAAVTASLSSNNVADIKSDLEQIQLLSTNKAKEATAFQTEVMQASQSGDKNALKGIVGKMKTYVESFNKDLDGLALKSTEVASIRDKMKESNNMGVEMSELGLAEKPDPQKIMELQKKGTALQQSLLNEMQALQIKVSSAK